MNKNQFKEKIKDRGTIIRYATVLLSIVILVFVLAKVIATENEKNRADVIDFGDIRNAVEASLDDMNITEDEARQVKILDFSEAPIFLPDFESLSCFENVESIIIEDSTINSFKGIEQFDKLSEIRIKNTRIDDISDLRDLDITYLSIDRCGDSGELDLGEMPQLLALDLSNNYLTSIRGDFPVLKNYKAANNEIETLDSMDIPQSTEILNIADNPIDDLDGIEKLDNINKLNVFHTNIDDFSALKGMENLNALYIDEDDMSDDLEYLYEDFRNGDNPRKAEYLRRYYKIEE